MHELSVCQALIAQVENVAREQGRRNVLSVRVKIGPLSGVEPQLLEQAYATACLGTLAESACLLIDLSPVRIQCETCGAESDAQPNHLLCARCGDFHTRLVSGDELMLMGVEFSV